MRHAWKRDDSGNVVPLDRDADHPVTQCTICGALSGCLYADPYCTESREEPRLDADDCEGLDLNITVSVNIHHPGKATGYDDRASVAMSTIIPLAALVSARDGDLALKALDNAVEVIAGSWRGARIAHETGWRAAAENASPEVAE